jgi:hypothetical protein
VESAQVGTWRLATFQYLGILLDVMCVQAQADLSRRAAAQLRVEDDLANRLCQLEERLQALERHHFEAARKHTEEKRG